MRSIVALLLAGPALCAGLDVTRDFLVRWPAPGAQAVALLRQAGAAAVVTPLQAAAPSGLAAIAELEGTGAALEEQARCAASTGYAGIAYHALSTEAATAAFAARRRSLVQFVYLKPEQIHWRVEPAHAVLAAGQWPGSGVSTFS